MSLNTSRFCRKRNIWRKVLSGLTTISLLVNSFLPYGVAGITYAQESMPSYTIVLEDPTPTDTPSPSPTENPTPSLTDIPTPAPSEFPETPPSPPETPTPTPADIPSPTPATDVTPTVSPPATPEPSPEATPADAPEATPSAVPEPSPEASPSTSPTMEATPSTESVAFSKTTIPMRKAGDFLKNSKRQMYKDYVDGEVIVKFKKEKLDISSVFGNAQANVFKRKFSLEKKDEIKASNIQVFTSKKSIEELVGELKAHPDVEYAQPNYIYKPTTISTNDTYKDLLWGLDNTGQTVNGTIGTNNADIDAPEAWNVDEGSEDVIVAVIDTGVAYNHPDLSASMWNGSSCKDENGNALGGCNSGYDYEDGDKFPLPATSSHGTHIAGTIAAEKNNGKGIIGVAPETKIMAIKSMLSTSEIVKGINFAENNGASIINASWAGSYNDTVLKNAINGFNGLFIAAAGNDGTDNNSSHYYPCDFDSANIICVAATDQNDNKAAFSNYSATSVDVGAPGTNIYSTIADISTTQPLNENFDAVVAPNIPSGWITTPLYFWGTNDFGELIGSVLYGDVYNYPYKSNANATTTTSNYNLSGSSAGSVSFFTECDTEYSTSSWTDYMSLEISTDGSNYTELLKWDEVYLDLLNGDSNPFGFASYYFDESIPANFLTNNFRLRFRWVTNSNSDTGTYGDGCKIDLLSINKYTVGSGETYDYMEGTSMAAPHVAGLAALLWGYKPNLTLAQVKDRILQTGNLLSSLNGKTATGRRVNAYNALNGLNNPPITTNGSISTNEDTAKAITLSGSDPDGDPLTYAIVSNPLHGILGTITGNQVTYTPDTNYVGSDSFTFKANDGTDDSNISTITITITPVNDAPIASNSSISTPEDTAVEITLSGSDADGDALIYEKVTEVSNGILGSISGNKLTYTPSTNYVGSDSFTFRVNDGSVYSIAATVSITVTALNDPPILDPIGNKSVDELANLTFTASATDPDSLPTYSLVNAPAGATIDPSTGVFSFTPTEAQGPGEYTFTVNATDGIATDFEEIKVTVNEVNSAPLAQDGPVSTNEDTSKAITLNAADSDIPANTLTYSIVSNPFHGTVSLSGNEATYTPTTNYHGSDTFTFKANDGTVDSNIAAISITVAPVNDAPVAINDSVSTDEDTAKTIILNATESDIPADILTYSIVSNPSHGVVALTGNQAAYTPDANYNGSDSFTFKANDGTADSNIATVSIIVNSVNDTPIADPQSVTTGEDTALQITLSGSDADGDALIYSIVSSPSNGILDTASDNQVTYTPNANYVGADSFTFKVDDTGILGLTNFNSFRNAASTQISNFFKIVGRNSFVMTSVTAATATVTIIVTPENDAPLANPDTASVDEDTSLTIAKATLLANDADVDGDSLTITTVSNPFHGSVSIDGNNVVFIPAANYSGPASFDYTVSDGSLTDTATVSVTVNPVNDEPVANPQIVTTEEDTSLLITLTASDIDGDSLIYSIETGAGHGSLGAVSGNQVTYTPSLDYVGSDSFEFKVYDGHAYSPTATVSIFVTPYNDPPVLDPIGNFSINELDYLTFTANASDPEGIDLLYLLNGNPSGATINSSTGIFSWTPAENQGPGSYTFSVVVSDGGKTDSEEITVTVNEVNQAPIAYDRSISTNEDIAKIIFLSATDVDLPANTLTYSIASNPSHGIVFLSENEVTYMPTTNYNGPDSFTFKVNDGTDDSNTATVSLTVFSVNDAPVATDDAVSTDEDTTLTIAASTLLANDSDVDDGFLLNIISISNPINGLVVISGINVIFTPNSNYNGTAGFDYTVSDGSLTDTAAVTVTVNPVNDAPVANTQSVATDEDTAMSITLSGSDADGDTLTYAVDTTPVHGTLSPISGNTVTYAPTAGYSGPDSFIFKVNDGMVNSAPATVAITVTAVNDPPILDPIGNKSVDELANLTFTASATDPDSLPTYSLVNAPAGATIDPSTGVFSFTPTEAQGPGSYSLTVNATDGTSTDSETITITVNEVNVSPVANDVSVSTPEDIVKNIALHAIDTDIPAQEINYFLVTNPAHGTLDAITDGKINYTPNLNYNGTDSFTYKVSDGSVESNDATVIITVNPVNDVPVANPDNASIDEDTTLTIAKSILLANDTDVDGDTLTLSEVSNPVHGTIYIGGDNVVFTPTANYSGSASFDYTVFDGTLTDTASVSVTVNSVNDAPVADDGIVTASQDTPVTIELSASDVDGDVLTYDIVLSPTNGTLAVILGNQVSYTPSANYTGSDSFTFKVNDATVDSNIATISITVNPPPVISDEATNTISKTSVTIAWTTDHPSTSRVIYDTVSHAVLDTAPNYGYANSTTEMDTSPKVTSHSVTISGLTAGITYYYRAVSHGSPEVVGDEKSFTTETENIGGGDISGSSTTSSTASTVVCSDQKPEGAPTLVSIVSSGPNEVTLFWTKAKDPVTYYLIAYGTKSGEMLYGNPFVGGRDTTSYTVKALSAGTEYFFKVRAGNNCMPGDFSNELAAHEVYGEMLNEIPEGFYSEALGSETTSMGEELVDDSISPASDISQSQYDDGFSGSVNRRSIFFVGIGLILLAAGCYFYIRRKRE